VAKRGISTVRKKPGENSQKMNLNFFGKKKSGKISREKIKWQFLIKFLQKFQVENSKALTVMISSTT